MTKGEEFKNEMPFDELYVFVESIFNISMTGNDGLFIYLFDWARLYWLFEFGMTSSLVVRRD